MDRDNLPVKAFRLRIVVGVSIMLLIAAIHLFRVGSYLPGQAYRLYYSYASDIMLPFGSYFLLAMNEIQIPVLRNWKTKAILVFSVMSFSELTQYFGIYFFGTTFDFVDIAMYALGTLLAIFMDKIVLEKRVSLWLYDKE